LPPIRITWFFIIFCIPQICKINSWFIINLHACRGLICLFY
jgi:hypothetical protein